MLRWKLLLRAYDHKIVFSPGIDNTNADGLSLIPALSDVDDLVPPNNVLLLETLEYPLLQATDIAKLTTEDCTEARVKQ